MKLWLEELALPGVGLGVFYEMHKQKQITCLGEESHGNAHGFSGALLLLPAAGAAASQPG